MTTYCAIVKYPLGSDDSEKIRLLRDGLGTVAIELIDLGCSEDDVEDALDEALEQARAEALAIAGEAY